MIVVSDTSPITNLAAIGHLNLLGRLFVSITIPDAVCRELTALPPGSPGAVDPSGLDWMTVKSVADGALVASLSLSLDDGEAEAIALAREMKSDLVLVDERRGRRAAERLGLKPLGLAGILLLAKRKGAISALKPLLDSLVGTAGFWISRELYARIIAEAGES